MNFVEPIRDKSKIKAMVDFLNKRNERDGVLFELGIHTGLRISDLLQLKKKDVKGSHIVVKEIKTKKTKRVVIVPQLKKVLQKYIRDMKDNDYLFTGRGTHGKPITRVRAYKILREAANECGLNNIGTHTMRKTFGFHFYNMNKDIAMLQELFNHSSPYITLRYIGVHQDAIDVAMMDMKMY
jgi:integrase